MINSIYGWRKTRYYDPEVSRFINMDDINMLPQLKQHINGLNLYIYANNNPVNLYDPDGRIFRSIGRWFNRNIIRPVTNFVNDPLGTINGWATDAWNSATSLWRDPLGTLGNFALDRINSALAPFSDIINGISLWNGNLNLSQLRLNPGGGVLGVGNLFGHRPDLRFGAPDMDPNWRPQDRFQRITGLIAYAGVGMMFIGAITIKIPFFGIGMLITGSLLAAIFGALSGGSVILTD